MFARGHLLRLAVVAAAAYGSLASTDTKSYQVKRSALVPHPAPQAWSGQPLDGPVQIAGQSETVLEPARPSTALGENVGLYVARTNYSGQLRIKVASWFDFGPLVEIGVADGAMAVRPNELQQPRGNTIGLGFGAKASIPLGDDGLRLGVALDVLGTSIPWRVSAVCISSDCATDPNAPMYVHAEGTTTVPIVSFSLLGSYQRGRVALFGGITFRNHPTNTGNLIEQVDVTQNVQFDGDVQAGDLNAILGGGVEVNVGSGLRLHLDVFEPVAPTVVAYGPVVGGGLSYTFSK